MCSLSLQDECDNYMTDVGVVLRVKIAIAVGDFCLTYLGVPDFKNFDISGPAIDDSNKAEKFAEPGSIVLSLCAWNNCDKVLFDYEELDNGKHIKVSV